MRIRKTTPQDLPRVMAIYIHARQFMADTGNPHQWTEGHPVQSIIEGDIAQGLSYVCVNQEDHPLAVFFFDTRPDATYGKIEGAWISQGEYGVIHRIASDTKGAGTFCINWCYEQINNIRIDTHRDNAPMRQLLDKLGYQYCGIIWLDNGHERMAYQKC